TGKGGELGGQGYGEVVDLGHDWRLDPGVRCVTGYSTPGRPATGRPGAVPVGPLHFPYIHDLVDTTEPARYRQSWRRVFSRPGKALELRQMAAADGSSARAGHRRPPDRGGRRAGRRGRPRRLRPGHH